jgi:hypothetical protein
LPQSSKSNISCIVDTKMLIVPAKDSDVYQLMVDAERKCELVPMRLLSEYDGIYRCFR